MKCCSHGKGLTLTSACDLVDTCHLCLYLPHAVIAQGVALLQQAHACTKFHHCFQHIQRQLNFSTYLTPRATKSGVRTPSPSLLSHGCKPFGACSHLVTISKIGLLVRLLWSIFASPSLNSQISHSQMSNCY